MAKSAILSVRIVGDSRNAVASIRKTSAAVAMLQRSAASTRGLTASLVSSTTRLAFLATVFSSLAATALTSVGSVISLGGALATILPVALLLPGALAGIAVGGGVLIAALKDAKEVLGDLGPAFSELQDRISGGFWEVAAQPIRDMVSTLLPAISDSLVEVANRFGGWAIAISGAISSAEGIAAIQSIIGSVRDAVDIAGDGVASFTAGLLGLSDVGASYLPRLAGWFNELAYSFEDWITKATESGEIFAWIDNGITQIGYLWQAITALGGIFSSLNDAATAAGYGGLSSFAAGMSAIDSAMASPAFQGALITIFSGALEATRALGPGLTALGGAFETLAPVISQIMQLGADAFGALLSGLADLLSHPAVAGGLISAFEGVNTGITAIGQALGPLAPLVGAALELFGALAASILPALAAVITTIAPPIATIVGAVADWVAANPQLAATALAVAAGLALIIPPVISLIGFIGSAVAFFSSLAATITTAVGTFSAMNVVFGLVGVSLTSIIGPILAVIGAFGVLAAGFIHALATSAEFQAAIGSLIGALIGLAAPIIDAVLPPLTQMGQAFMDLWGTVMDALTPIMTAVVELGAAVISALQPVADFIGGLLGPVFSWLADTVSSAFDIIGSIISAASDFITGIINALTAAIRGDWDAMWSNLGSAAGAGLELVKNIFIGGLQFVVELIWNTVWRIIEFFGNLLTGVIDIAGRLFNFIVSAATEGMVSLAGAIGRGIENVMQFFRDLPANVGQALSNFGAKMKTIGDQIISGLVEGIKGAAGKATQAVKDTVGGAIDGAKKLLGIKSPSRVFRSIGRFTSEGLAIGINQMAPKALNAVQNMTSRVVEAGAGLTLQAPSLAPATLPPAHQQGISSPADHGQPVVINVPITVNGYIGNELELANRIEQALKFKKDLISYA